MKFNPLPLSWFTSLLISTRFENVIAEECEAGSESKTFILLLIIALMFLTSIALTFGWMITCVFLFVKKRISKPTHVITNNFAPYSEIDETNLVNSLTRETFDIHGSSYEIMKPIDKTKNLSRSTPDLRNIRERIPRSVDFELGDKRTTYANMK